MDPVTVAREALPVLCVVLLWLTALKAIENLNVRLTATRREVADLRERLESVTRPRIQA